MLCIFLTLLHLDSGFQWALDTDPEFLSELRPGASSTMTAPGTTLLQANLTRLHATVLPLEGTRLWLTDRSEDRLPQFYSTAIDCECVAWATHLRPQAPPTWTNVVLALFPGAAGHCSTSDLHPVKLSAPANLRFMAEVVFREVSCCRARTYAFQGVSDSTLFRKWGSGSRHLLQVVTHAPPPLAETLSDDPTWRPCAGTGLDTLLHGCRPRAVACNRAGKMKRKR
jgi:hypothetical protein